EVDSEPFSSFLDKIISLVEGAERRKTPNEIALLTLLITLTIIFLVVILTLYPIARYLNLNIQIATLNALTVCLIPTT
ncbi:potassium-transporting ATPase subunit B, partial [Staphylococcus felis]|nr:potassium-transporting ATPase subunit B [Staphylococcus felis]